MFGQFSQEYAFFHEYTVYVILLNVLKWCELQFFSVHQKFKKRPRRRHLNALHCLAVVKTVLFLIITMLSTGLAKLSACLCRAPTMHLKHHRELWNNVYLIYKNIYLEFSKITLKLSVSSKKLFKNACTSPSSFSANNFFIGYTLLRQCLKEGLIYVVYKKVDGEVCQIEWCRYKCFWIGNELGTGGVGVLLAEK